MFKKIFGKKASEADTKKLAKKFVTDYVKSSDDCDDVIKNVVKPLYKAAGTDIILDKYSHIMTDLNRKEYNSLKLGIYSQNLLSEVEKSGKHTVFENIAKELAFKTIDKQADEQRSRKQERLVKNASNLLGSNGTSYEKMKQERQDEEFAKKLQKQLHHEPKTFQEKAPPKKVRFKEEEEKREIEPADYQRYDYEVDSNVERNASMQEIEDERLARILQNEEDSKADSFAKRYEKQKKLKKPRVRNVESEDISPQAILNQRSQRELQRQDYIDGMMKMMTPF